MSEVNRSSDRIRDTLAALATRRRVLSERDF